MSGRILSAALFGVTLVGAPLAAQRATSPLPVPATTTLPAPPTLPAFMVTDQFDRPLARGALTGSTVLFLVAAREGADAARRWFGALREPARARGIRIVSVADLKGAPRFLRGLIRRGFPKDTAEAILMDFDGRLGRALRGEKPALVAVVYAADGRLQRAMELPLGDPDAAIGAALLGAARTP